MQELSQPAAGDADWQKLAPVLDQAIGELAERDRDAVVLRFFEGRPFAEIGATLRLTEDAARMRVERALDKLRTALGRRDITSTSAALGIALVNQATATAPAGVAASVTGAALAASAGSGAATGFLAFMTINKASAGALVAIAAVLALNIGQQRVNARLWEEYRGLAIENRNLEALRMQNRRSAVAAMATPDEAAELARLQALAEELRQKIATRRSPLLNGGILRVGGKAITRDTPPDVKLEVIFREGRSSPMRSWQTLLSLGQSLTRADWANHDWVDLDMMALMFCLDDPAQAKIEAFLAALPVEARSAFRSSERLLAPVFSDWLWQGDWPKGYGSSGGQTDAYAPGDPTRAYTQWEVTRASGRKQVERFPFKRFDDGWRYGPLSAADVEQMLALLDPRTGQPKVSVEVAR